MKRIYSLLIASLCVACCNQSANAFTHKNWYLSAEVGLFQGMNDLQYKDVTDVIPGNYRQTVSQYGYVGGIAGGYSKIFCNRYLLGAELALDWNTNSAYFSAGASSASFADKVTNNANVDLTFVPGLLLTDTLAVYAKIGPSFSSISDHIVSPIGFNPVMVTTNAQRNVIGGAFGLGLKKMVTKHIIVFSEFNYHDYGTVNFPNFQNFSATYSHSTHVYSVNLLLGASYYL